MAKKKMINLEALDSSADEAKLQGKIESAPPTKTKEFVVRGVPADIPIILKEHGHTFAGFAKIAVQEKMKRDGLI